MPGRREFETFQCKKIEEEEECCSVYTASSGLDKFFFSRQLFLLFCIVLVVIKCPRNRFDKRSTFESTYPIQKGIDTVVGVSKLIQRILLDVN